MSGCAMCQDYSDTGYIPSNIVSMVKHTKVTILTFDSDYYVVTDNQFSVIYKDACAKMLDDGWVKYLNQSRDCDDFALKMISELKYSYFTKYVAGERGVAIGLVIYNPDNGDARHAVVFADVYKSAVLSERRYYEPYPWYKEIPIVMSDTELQSINVIIK